MQQDSGTVLVEEIQNPIASLSHPEPRLTELTFDLRSVRKIESRATSLQQIDSGNDLASNAFWQPIKPF